MKLPVHFMFIPLFSGLFFSYSNLQKGKTIALSPPSAVYIQLDTTGPRKANLFQKYVGDWGSKDGIFETSFGGKYSKNIDSSRTHIARSPSNNSLLWDANMGFAKIVTLWSFDKTTKVIHYLSASAEVPMSHGTGTMDADGNTSFKLSHEGDCKNCYRMYQYKFISNNEIAFRATLYKNGKQTGDYYAGTLVRKIK